MKTPEFDFRDLARNLIINGDMRINQRFGGNTITTGSLLNTALTLDRWVYNATQAAKFTAIRDSAGGNAANGLPWYHNLTCVASYTPLTGDYFLLSQHIEGNNTIQLAWGTSSAKAVTLSFWTKSSVTGTLGGVIRNGAQNRSYPFSYTVLVANVWEYKTIVIPGDTAGTWLTNNGIGMSVFFSLGAGASLSGPANTWASANYVSASGATNVVTNGATWNVTGVQINEGAVAAPFQHRSASDELILCQRYYEKSYDLDTPPLTATNNGAVSQYSNASTSVRGSVIFRVVKRDIPTPCLISKTFTS